MQGNFHKTVPVLYWRFSQFHDSVTYSVLSRNPSIVHALILPCVTKPWYMLALSNIGVYITAASSFKFSYDNAKLKFYRAFNALYCRSACSNCELVSVELVKAYCLPMLLYAVYRIDCPLQTEHSYDG